MSGNPPNKNQNLLNIANMRDNMKAIEEQSGSPTMCTAKWLQSTVYLMNGHTHSCHHPSVHKIPISEIKKKPSALHNTEFKIERRKEMLAGKRPTECQYCWNVEDLPGDHMSDRTYKSASDWSLASLDKVMAAKEGSDITPSYLEVAFDNTCNLKCMYCTPDISSKWMEEIKQYGPYNGTTYNVGDIEWLKVSGKMPIPNREENPYVDAFWEWWPELYSNLHTFRITGGEPLLSKQLWRVLEEIKNNPRPDLTLGVNTNLQVPDELVDKFIEYYNAIAPNIKAFTVFTSCEAHGKQADYIRTGLDYPKFMSNVDKFLSKTGTHSRVNFMVTFNALSLSTFDQFLADILAMRSKFNHTNAYNRVAMMVNYLRWPRFQDVRVAPQDVKELYLEKIRAFVDANKSPQAANGIGMFYLEEVDQVARLGEYMFEPLSERYMQEQMRDFGVFYPEYDRRRDVDFRVTFPELNNFLDQCIEVANAQETK